jgi:hypothetical protein
VQLQEKAVAAATDSEMKGILQKTLDALKKGELPPAEKLADEDR